MYSVHCTLYTVQVQVYACILVFSLLSLQQRAPVPVAHPAVAELEVGGEGPGVLAGLLGDGLRGGGGGLLPIAGVVS